MTAADKAANDIICDGLRKLPGNFPIISEENKQIPYEVRKDYTYCWMVDPLDGTKEFIKRNGEFTINIALLRHNAPVLGIIHIPVTDITYFGCYQYGAFRLIDGNWEKLSADRLTVQTKNWTSSAPDRTLVALRKSILISLRNQTSNREDLP